MSEADREYEEIKKKVTSADRDVLDRSLAFVSEKRAEEIQRGHAAITRGQLVLVVIGVLIVVTVPLADTVISVEPASLRYFVLIWFGGSVAFLAKGAINAIRIIRPLKGYRAIPDFVFLIQNQSYEDAIRDEIALRIWEYQKSLTPNNRRLFQLDRCARNTVMAIFLLVLVGASIATSESVAVAIPSSVNWGALVVVVAAFFFWDKVVEKFGIWDGKNE